MDGRNRIRTSFYLEYLMKKALLALGLALHMVVFVLMNPVATILTITFGGLYIGYHFVWGLINGVIELNNTLKVEA